MALMPFIFGGNTGIKTPQEAARLRAIAEALSGQRRAPHTIGEGLSAIGDAIAQRRAVSRADRIESEGRAAYESKYGDLVKSLISGGGGAAAEPVPTAPAGIVPQPPDMSQAGVGSDYAATTNIATSQLPPPEDLAAMVRTVIGEAGNQSPEAQRAVAEVILNRSRETGMTPQQVVMAKGQFEPWQTRGAELNAIDPNSQQYQSVLGNITSAFGPDDPTGGADHFYSPQGQVALGRDAPDWARGQTGTDIGDQRFYKLGYGGDAGTSSAQDATAAQAAGKPDQMAGLSIDAEPGNQQAQPQQPGVQQVAANGFDPRLIDALSDPWIPEGQKAVLEELFKQQLKRAEPPDYGFTTQGTDIYRTNPRTGQVERVIDNPDAPKPYSFTTEGGDIFKMDPNTGKVEKAYDNPAAGEPGGPADEYGTTPIYLQDDQGNSAVMQISKSGGAKKIDLPPGFKLTPGVKTVDLKTGVGVLDRAGNIIGVIPKDVAGEAADKAAGTATGTAKVNLPGVEEAAGRAFGTIDDLLNDPALPNLTGAVESRLPTFREDTARAEAKLKLLQGQVFLQAYNDLRGAGQISEQEGQAAKEAYSRLQATGVSDPDFVKALREYRVEIQKLVNVARQKAGQPPLPIDEGPAETLPEGVSEEDIQHTMQVHGWTREQVLERLKNAP